VWEGRKNGTCTKTFPRKKKNGDSLGKKLPNHAAASMQAAILCMSEITAFSQIEQSCAVL